MQIDELLQFHSRWKIGLRAAIQQRQPMNVHTVGNADLCELGHWLRFEGRRRYGHLPAFSGLKQAHQALHAAAATLVEMINAGEYRSALQGMHPGSEFAEMAERFVTFVELLRRQARHPLTEVDEGDLERLSPTPLHEPPSHASAGLFVLKSELGHGQHATVMQELSDKL